MANYYASCRANYFQVKNEILFRQWADTIPDIEVHGRDDLNKGFTLLGNSPYGCGWPQWRHDPEDEFSIYDELAPHLAEGSVAIFMEVGAEKLRYLVGMAVAVHPDGRIIAVNLESTILQMVEDQWGITPTDVQY